MSAFSGGFEHYAPWKTIDGRDVVAGLPALEVLVRGVFESVPPARIVVRNYTVFSDEAGRLGQACR